MDFVELNYDSVNLITTIQVTNCAKETLIDVNSVVYDSPDYYALLETIAQSVLVNMNPESPTYDPTLVG